MPKPPNPSRDIQGHPIPPSDDTSGRLMTDPIEAARYIAEFAAELSVVARHAKLELLAYILDMARLEATRAQRGSDPAGESSG